ncbi:hypothetical protein [Kushneria marisflavi]|uniref:Uncharacterized protein n=1 Tax=Kushneria marisflavi TaxID=157779 RepID=A0A240UQ34_9GAMM|nr:hypothetical protein [Kushneria marisflavi]ART63152.1 hypothetical protein B9H00_08865 [Kushneria marisflavi]RKD84590.1 hypothetical protein C8D96_1812 [Kushneria marisflavi]
MNIDISLSISMALTDLSRQMLEQGKTQADTLVCAKGCLYRASMTLDPVTEENLQDVINEYLPEKSS